MELRRLVPAAFEKQVRDGNQLRTVPLKGRSFGVRVSQACPKYLFFVRRPGCWRFGRILTDGIQIEKKRVTQGT